jgi:nucleoid-associated protein YgaU
MRKDVKFGLTIGAILVITLVIYVIVLSRGPAAQRNAVVQPSQSDQAAAASTDSTSNSSVAPQSPEDSKPDVQTEQDNTDNPPSNIPAPTQSTTPAAQPTAAVPSANSDWQGALDHGLPMTVAAPEHTVTPTIDPAPAGIAHGGISRTPTTPLIDPLPSTQPSRLMLADIPTLEASVPIAPAEIAPAPVTAVPTQIQPPYVSAATASTAPNIPRTHRVEAGESPYSISETVYGNGKYYKKILAANPGIDPRHLKIGQILVIPELTDAGKPALSNQASSETINPNTSYKVAAGDSLESISRKLYGTPQMMDKIYQFNRKLIGPDENVLKIGWILQLPQAPETAEGSR